MRHMSRRLAFVFMVFVTLKAWALPTFDEVKASYRPSDVEFVDRHGEPIQTLRVDLHERRLPWVKLEDMSPALLRALVLSEDKRFYQHSGIDWSAVANSAWGNLWNTRTRGASTLTMQLAGLLEPDLARPVGGRSVIQKIDQAWIATRLEQHWTKAQIIEAYLNRVNWRGEIVGVGALAETLFSKRPSGLDMQESAIAAALVRGPNAPAKVVTWRACGVLKEEGQSCQGLDVIVQAALLRSGRMPLGEQIAPQFARAVKAQWNSRQPMPPVVRTALDARIQRMAVNALREQMALLAGRHVEDGAVVVLDNATGEVLAWVGSSTGTSQAADVDGVLARRQPGSTLKPFAYELAFEKRLITPASLLHDAPAQLPTAFGLYLPQNYDKDFKGWISARTALGSSLNVPAVKVAAMLGPDALFERLQALGFHLPRSGSYHGLALVLGSADVSLLDLANAYRALANGGRYGATRLVAASKSDAKARPLARVADPAAVALVTDILADNNARVPTFGIDSALVTRGFAAVKTGTSKDLRDNWCVGFTDRYTVGVWVGNADGTPMQSVSGVSGAAPVWRTLVQALHDGRPSRAPSWPSGVVARHIRYDQDREAERDELFLAGTEQEVVAEGTQVAASEVFGISNPRDGSVYALDPDIPPEAQKLRFEGEPGRWLVDGKSVGQGREVMWAPWPGRHELVLESDDGRRRYAVRFDVRGASVRSASR